MAERPNPRVTRIIYDPRLAIVNPETPIPGRGKKGRQKDFRPFELSGRQTNPDAIRLGITYLENQRPQDYEISPREATIAKALTAISMEKTGTEKSPVYTPVYRYSQVDDLVTKLAQKNPDTKAVRSLVDQAIQTVVASYRTAMAMREHKGVLPAGSPKIEELIGSLEGCTLSTDTFSFTPFASLSAGGLYLALRRETSAILLTETSRTRDTRKYIEDLGNYLAAS